MSEVDALYRLLNVAPLRSAEIVKRVTLAGTDFPAIAALYGVDEARARVLVFRAFLDVQSGGSLRVPDDREAVEIEAMTRADAPSTGEGAEARQLWNRLVEHREGLKARLDKAAAEFAASPDRDRDEWLRRLAIVIVLALTAYFWWREQTKPLPPPQKRPTTAPVSK